MIATFLAWYLLFNIALSAVVGPSLFGSPRPPYSFRTWVTQLFVWWLPMAVLAAAVIL